MSGEIDLGGLYLSSVVPTALLAMALTWLLRGLLGRLGLYRHLWHPALFEIALFVILWATLVACPFEVCR